ncbi:glycosyltransferase family 4 protein [Flavobacterium aquicola]|uniref:Glycosyltransferase involved in cell wall biosynthesis n=1 Tax=Flavobacterium aquicola TaxID=1682742 RepID=A0A3E0EJB5_9FLAO|nr:glycosyltransferase family 4 protein [Flavobacterium aquicola]REG98288.1 glycosyltransferase involved in cell wall biosynthesis [Flavobacterium aquicola]
MKTILIAHNYTEDSFAYMSYNLAHHLAERGNRVVFISHKPFFKEIEIVKNEIGEIVIISWPSDKRPTSFKDVLWFSKIYSKYKPEFVIGHFVGSNITISISKLMSSGKVKTLAYYHTLSKQILADSKTSFIKRKILFFRKKIFYKLFCDIVVCPSELAKKDLESFYGVDKGVVVLNPMADRFTAENDKSKENIIISYLGRLDDSKGVIEMVKAFIFYKQKNVNSKIIVKIAGGGSKQKEITALIDNEPAMEFIGGLKYNEIDKFLRDSYFAIIPSKSDNLPTVGLESLMNGTPLLISKATGLSDYLVDSRECFKFEPNVNSIMALFEKIESEKFNYKEMSMNARSTYLNLFSFENYFLSISKLLSKK